MNGSLSGRRIIVTREQPGELAEMLERREAIVMHVPLIAVVDADDQGSALAAELERLDRYDWLIVTSAAGAERVGAAATSAVKLAAVGTASARALARTCGRRVDLVPRIQYATALAEEFSARERTPQRVLIAQADRAGDVLATDLRADGHEVTTVVAYRTVIQRSDPDSIRGADAVLFASGSSVEGWVASFGERHPPIAVAIGPSAAAVAERFGLELTGVAAEYSLNGLVTELERQFARTDAESPMARDLQD